MRTALHGIILALLLSGPSLSNATSLTYIGTLSGLNEAVPTSSPGTGLASITVDTSLNLLTVDVTFSNLLNSTTIGTSSGTTAAHIHCCTDPGTNAGVATQLPTFIGFPLGVTAGTYNHTFDMSLTSSYNPAFITNNGGSVTSAFASLLAGLDAGKAYLNIHTNAFPGGEVRANLVPSVPEPGSLGLLLLGLGALGIRQATRRLS